MRETNGAGPGADLTAGKHLTLTAEDEIKLLAAANTANQRSTNKNSSASVGFSIGTDGLLFNIGASAGRGQADGDDLAWTHSHVTAGETLTLQSGGDTTLKGAVAQGEQVIADVGGDLKIESLQDQSTYDSKQKSAGFTLSVGAGKVSGSVTEQSGLKAGDAGFQVKVEGDMDLKGAVIASSDAAARKGRNQLATGTLSLRILRWAVKSSWFAEVFPRRYMSVLDISVHQATTTRGYLQVRPK